MSVPVIVLKRDHSLDQLSLQCNVSGARQCLVDLARDEKLDRLPVDYYDSFTKSDIVSRRAQGSPNPRKRLSFTIALSRFDSGKVGQSRRRKIRTLTNPTHQDGHERRAMLNTRRKLLLPNISKQNNSKTTASLNSRTKGTFDNAIGKDCTEKSFTLDRRIIQSVNNVSNQNGSAKTTLERKSSQTLANSSNQGGSESPLSDRQRSSSHSPQDQITKEDFLALLSLSPSHVTQRARKCTHHRISKFLNIKARDLWRKICREENDCFARLCPDAKTVLRPSYVLLKRSSIIDQLALKRNPQSINLKSFLVTSNVANHRKILIDSPRQSLHTLSVVLKRDSGLEQLALKIPKATCTPHSSNSGTSVSSPYVVQVTSTVPLSKNSSIIQATESSSCERAFVRINRDTVLDTLALQNSMIEPSSTNFARMNVISSYEDKLTNAGLKNFSCGLKKGDPKNLLITIKRDASIDQLARENFNTTVTDSCSSCNSSTGPNHLKLHRQPSSNFPLDRMTSIHTRRKLGLLDVMKLRRVSRGDWSVIQSEEPSLRTPGPNHAGVEPNRNQCDSIIQPQSSTYKKSESPGYRRAALEPAKNSFIGQFALSSSNSGRPEGGLDHDTLTNDVQSNTHRPTLSRISSDQTVINSNHVLQSSARKHVIGIMKTVSSVSCSALSTRRAKSVPSKEETPPEVHHNENKNPQKHDIPSIKTVILNRKSAPTRRVVTPLVLRRSCKRPVENDLFDHTKLKATRRKDFPDNYDIVKTSISLHMPIKKPLGQQSPNSQST